MLEPQREAGSQVCVCVCVCVYVGGKGGEDVLCCLSTSVILLPTRKVHELRQLSYSSHSLNQFAYMNGGRCREEVRVV